MTPRKTLSNQDRERSRSVHDREMREDSAEAYARSSSGSVELRLVDPGDGDVRVVLTAVLSDAIARRESCALESPHLGEWLRCKLGTYCRVPKKGAQE